MPLDAALASAAPALRGLTLWPCEKGWQANITRDGKSWRVAISADPVAALLEALTDQRQQPEPPSSNSVFD